MSSVWLCLEQKLCKFIGYIIVKISDFFADRSCFVVTLWLMQFSTYEAYLRHKNQCWKGNGGLTSVETATFTEVANH